MKMRKSLIMMMITVFTMMLFSGCSKNSDMGRYIEKDLKGPEGIMYMTEFTTLENGDIAIIANGEDYEKYNYYTSSNNGDSWESKELKIPEAPAGKDMYVRHAKIKPDGSLFMIYQINDEFKEEFVEEEVKEDDTQTGLDEEGNYEDFIMNSEYKCVSIDASGNETEVPIDNALLNQSGRIEIDNNGDIYFDNYETSKIVQLDGKTGAVKKEYKSEEDYISSWAVNGKDLLLGSFENLVQFDTETGKNKGTVQVSTELKSGGITIYSGKDEGMFYITNSNGVYSYKVGGKAQEQIIDGTLSSFGDSNNYVQKLVQKSDDEFIASMSDMEGKNVIKHYKYDSEIASKPENQISIYAMYDNDMIRQAIVMYQKDHPDVYMDLEIGMSYFDETATVTDAIKKVNTEIMAGKGPDIIILDELPSKSYAEKGLLEDITDIVSKDDLLLSSIVNGSKAQDGKIYSAPLRFFVPVIMGQNINGVNSVSTLASSIGDISSKATGSVIDVFTPDELVYLLYKNSGDAWVNADKTINTDNLKSFLDDTKKIYDSIKDKHPAEKIQRHDEDTEMMKEYAGEQSMAEMRYLNGTYYNELLSKNPTSLCIYNLSSAQDLMTLEAIKEAKETITYDVWKGQDTNSLIPLSTISINAKSEKKDIAKDFVSELFSEKYQKTSNYYGLSVNKTALKDSIIGDENQYGGTMGFGIDEDETFEIEMKKLPDEVINGFIEKIESFDSVANPDIEVIRKTIDDFTAYILGQKSIDDTIKAIQSKLEIYLAE